MMGIEEAARVIDIGVDSLADDFIDPIEHEGRGQFRSARVLYCVNRDEVLIVSTDLDSFADDPSRVIGRETSMIGWVPVLRRYHHAEKALQLVDNRNDRSAVWDSQRATGQKIILQIDQN